MINKMNYKNGIALLIIALAVLVLAPNASAVVTLSVNSFSCTPSEVAINNDFSCTARIINTGDETSSSVTATLYPDSNNWLEESTYEQTTSEGIGSGLTAEINFPVRAIKSGGSNGFSKITLGAVTDTSGVDGVTVNVIDAAITASDSASSRAAGQEFTSTAEVTAGGNIDVSLTFAVNSGGCSIGNQPSTKIINNMQNNDRQSLSWTVTMGTTGDCRYTITASATGDAGLAAKSDAISRTVSCSSGCTSVSTSSSSSSGGGGGGGGGGIGTLTKNIGELITSVQEEIAKGEYIAFTFGEENHSISVTNLTETTATIVVKSNEQRFTMSVGEEKKIDFESDGKYDINIRLQSISLITKKALFIITPLYIPKTGKTGEEAKADGAAGDKKSGSASGDKGKFSGGVAGKSYLWWSIALIAGIIIVGMGIIILKNFHKHDKIRRSVNIKHFHKHDKIRRAVNIKRFRV